MAQSQWSPKGDPPTTAGKRAKRTAAEESCATDENAVPLRHNINVRHSQRSDGSTPASVVGAIVPTLLFCSLVFALEVGVAGARPSVALFTQIFSAICAVLLAALWAQRRDHVEYGWLALLALSWVLFASTQGSSGSDGPAATWLASLGPVVIALLTLAFSRSSISAGHWRWSLTLGILALISVLLAGRFEAITPAARTLGLVSLVLVCGSVILSEYQTNQNGGWGVVAHTILLTLSLVDIGTTLGIYDSIRPQLVLYAGVVFVGTYSWWLLSRFIDDLRRTEALNLELDQRVKDRTRELRAQHQQVQTMQKAQVLADERERIMRDMHDGVGGQLVSTLAMIEADHCDPTILRDALGEALTDMRLMIDSLAPVHNDLNAVLATFRERMQPRLDAAGIELKWQVSRIPPADSLGPASVLCVLRILQETVTNALKHADADLIVVVTEQLVDGLGSRIMIRDNGNGFDTTAVESGYGINNMRERAAECGFIYTLESQRDEGTTTRLDFATQQLPKAGEKANSVEEAS